MQQQLAGLMPECLESSEYFALYGQAQLNNGQLSGALEALERALLIDPNNGAAGIDYAQALFEVVLSPEPWREPTFLIPGQEAFPSLGAYSVVLTTVKLGVPESRLFAAANGYLHADGITPIEAGDELGEDWYAHNLSVAEQRLQQGGIRLALVLDEIF